LFTPQVLSAVQGRLVFSFDSSNGWENYEIWRPFVIYDGSKFMMWYSGDNSSIGFVDNIGLAASSDGLLWSRDPSNPVLRVGVAGQWDADSVNEPWVIHENGEYKMWYSGQLEYTNGSLRTISIGYATSPDGVTWTKYSGNPIFTPGPTGSWDDGAVSRPIVIHSGTGYTMYYVGDSLSWKRGWGRATSDDGINWVRSGQVSVPTSNWDSYYQGLGGITVLGNGVLIMVYWGRASENGYSQIGMASSTDGIAWTPLQGNPIITYGSGMWDAGGLEYPMILVVGEQYLVYYSTYGPGSLPDRSVGLAILSMSDYPVPEYPSAGLILIVALSLAITLMTVHKLRKIRPFQL
jgi:predicted GH43/DUF377 family glycosyl hydrolase